VTGRSKWAEAGDLLVDWSLAAGFYATSAYFALGGFRSLLG
jgi:hypothetical protein